MIDSKQQWFGAKALAKRVVRYVPGYNRAMRGLLGGRSGAAWVRRLPVAPTDVSVQLPDGQVWMVRPDRCEIAKQLFWTGGIREPREDRVALDWFFERSRQAAIVLDIGCNSGLFALAAARANPSARVIAFDLLPEAVQICLENVLRNDVAMQVEVRLQGLGAPDSSFRVPLRAAASGMPSSVSTEFEFRDGVDVPIRSLDALLAELPTTGPVLAKIDVEATEHNIFAHGRAFLAARRPAMLCELLKRAQVQAFEPMLRELGYRFALITDEGPVMRETLEPHARFKDWLFLPDDAGN